MAGLSLARSSALLLGIALFFRTSLAQRSVPPPVPVGPNSRTLIPLQNPTISPGAMELVKLEGDFEEAVARGGGKTFASWFAEDGVTLNNGQPAVRGQRAIAAQATWDPGNYQLTWYAEGAQMGPGGQTGFTWGHYDAKGTDPRGAPVASSGRYITFWKKVNGHWKVALDASADDAPPIAPLP